MVFYFFKRDHYGIRGIANEEIISYGSNRTLYLKIKEYPSVLLSIKCHVPQRS